jgi:hypothetical protein
VSAAAAAAFGAAHLQRDDRHAALRRLRERSRESFRVPRGFEKEPMTFTSGRSSA